MTRLFQKLARSWVWLSSHENLDSTRVEPTGPDPSFLRGLFSSEDLPESPPTPEDAPSGISTTFLSWLSSRENLLEAGGSALEFENQSNQES